MEEGGGGYRRIILDKSLRGNYNIIMEMLFFEWDENKNAVNKVKHRVSFEEAETVFYDENAVMIPDPDHSDEAEERFILLGFSAQARLLLVCHCYRSADSVIRIISARKATAQEARQYDDMEV